MNNLSPEFLALLASEAGGTPPEAAEAIAELERLGWVRVDDEGTLQLTFPDDLPESELPPGFIVPPHLRHSGGTR